MSSLIARARSSVRALAPAFLAALAPATSAQWDVIPYNSLAPVFEDGFIVIHENSAGINAFSAAARKWNTVSPPGSVLFGFGDWTMLTREPGPTFRGYSARRNDSATLTLTGTAAVTLVHDDVILVIENASVGSSQTAHGYSAVHNTWTSVGLGSTGVTAAEVAISRFVTSAERRR